MKYIGYLMIIVLYFGLFIMGGLMVGWIQSIAIFICSALIMGWIYIAVHLTTKR